ncbi:MAG TPA: hypothetical protein VMW53_11580 [archaeon]|nr:hypothetical protein [archaeon]
MLPKGVTFKEVNAFEGEGAVRAKQLGISSVPTVDIKELLDSITG